MATTTATSSSSSSSGRSRNSSSAGTLRSSIPSMRASLSAAECACSEQTTTFRPVSSRAAIRAVRVEVEAVSSMCPCQLAGRPSSWASQSRVTQLELGRGGRGAPEERHLVERGREQLGQDRRLRAARREVGEEARRLPVGDPRHQHLVEVAQDRGERLPALRRRGGQRGADLARLDLREHRALADALEVAGGPVDRRVAVLPEAHFISSLDLGPGARVQHLRLRQPGAPGLGEREVEVPELVRAGARPS